MDKTKVTGQSMPRILVTGASGFVGTGLCSQLLSKGFSVTAALRKPPTPFRDERIRSVYIGHINELTDWTRATANSDFVVHLAGRAHVMREHTVNPITAYREVNVAGTVNLANSAVSAGVKRFIYMSSVKVNGEENDQAYTELKDACPNDPYGMSKMEAELELMKIATKNKMELVIIRPPLVYGPGVKANFLSLLKLVDYSIPLPLASIRNRRSFIYLGNLIDCVIKCLTHPAAAGRIYLVSDDQDMSTPELIRIIAASMNRRAVFFPFPTSLLQSAGQLLGRAEVVSRILGSLTIDMSRIKKETGWTPPYSPETGLMNTVQWFKNRSAL